MGISKSGLKNLGLKIFEADNENDIKRYLEDSVANMDLEDDELEQKILNSLRQGARGMFLWARLMMEGLSVPGRSIEEYEIALEDLPEGLDEVYGQVLHKLHSNSHRCERSQQLFQWLVCAYRPLMINELKVALAVVLDEEHLQPKKVIPKFKDTLRLCCEPLIDIDDTTGGAILLTHAFVKDFLLSTPRGSPMFSSLFVESKIAHVYIARACLTYLCFNEIGVVDVNKDCQVSLYMIHLHFGTWEFLKYASANSYKHRSECITFPKAVRSFRRLYSSEYNTVKWLQLMDSLKGKGDFSINDVIQVLLYFHSTRLLKDDRMYEQWLTHLVGPPSRSLARLSLAFREGVLSTPIFHTCAAINFDTLVKKIIGEKGSVDGFLDLISHAGCIALHNATTFDAVEVTKILLRAGASIDARCILGKTPLMYAVGSWKQHFHRRSSFEVASILIKSGADVSLDCGYRQKALIFACDILEDDETYSRDLIVEARCHKDHE